ncbi:MAG TPA: hypothetical protein PKA88_06285 [Polyangiaceae bacterium]|nr:hypothetical protein [Polyangiaceae bacterium]HMR74433.1 hypothetical protein [Polyangiaceae bacterium]
MSNDNTNTPPPGYTERADVYHSREDWLALLQRKLSPTRNPATRALLESGHCTFTTGDGVRHAGPAVGPAPERATHTTRMRVDSLTEKGKTTWIN